MVSTRGTRYKFSEGERVLCYEPDPTKAKVLYDSKVLEVTESKDKRGRRTVEYLIHFQGWNSSWDRCVSEDFVLKDTEENRQLQRDLAEKSQLQLGAYLYRRERKKGSSSSGPGPTKRARHGFSDDGSSSSTQPDDGETGDTDTSSGSESSSQPRSPPANMQSGRAQIILPSALRDRLTFDYHLVMKRGRLSRLPATPNVADILESFVKWFARAGAWKPARPRQPPHEPPQRPDMLEVSCRLNLVREVADGLRVYFDFILRGHLLYKQELNQYHEICGQFIDDAEEEQEIKCESENEIEEEEAVVVEDGANAGEGASTEEGANEVLAHIASPKLPEYSHLPPDPDHAPTEENTETQNGEAKSEELSAKESSEGRSTQSSDERISGENHAPRTSGLLARRLRSHKSAVSQSESEEPAPSTSAFPPSTAPVFENTSSSVGSSGSSTSEPWPQAAPTEQATPTQHTRTPLSLLFDEVAKWQIIPREGTEHLPCRIYGAIHLARLFVKLPDFLNATPMPDFKLKLILKHIDIFVQYLNEHSEWFGETYYICDNVSRSH